MSTLQVAKKYQRYTNEVTNPLPSQAWEDFLHFMTKHSDKVHGTIYRYRIDNTLFIIRNAMYNSLTKIKVKFKLSSRNISFCSRLENSKIVFLNSFLRNYMYNAWPQKNFKLQVEFVLPPKSINDMKSFIMSCHVKVIIALPSFVIQDEMIVCMKIIMMYLRTLITKKKQRRDIEKKRCKIWFYFDDEFLWKIEIS